YVALSHRWGTSQHFTTTKETMAAREQGFHQDQLPATYRDAVTTARNLGFAYLWIDSLCIVQDDAADWKSESQRMGNIFKHASFTIAAHCARGDDEGFLARALVKRGGTVDHHHHKTSPETSFTLYRRGNLAMDVTASALCRRGWVLQERFMASRTIHFTDGQVFAETTDTESTTTFYSPSAAPALRAMFGLGPHRAGAAECLLSPITPTPGEPLTVPLEWLDLVEMYSNCELTKASDKLMAIAGMAREIQRQTGSVWAAGLWGDILLPSLLWMPGAAAGLRRPACPRERAPSWSWAAWDGSV
ncbi:heterokaryon incompatibility protein-domain-containing protein, partial [Podospora appendiculata]